MSRPVLHFPFTSEIGWTAGYWAGSRWVWLHWALLPCHLHIHHSCSLCCQTLTHLVDKVQQAGSKEQNIKLSLSGRFTIVNSPYLYVSSVSSRNPGIFIMSCSDQLPCPLWGISSTRWSSTLFMSEYSCVWVWVMFTLRPTVVSMLTFS